MNPLPDFDSGDELAEYERYETRSERYRREAMEEQDRLYNLMEFERMVELDQEDRVEKALQAAIMNDAAMQSGTREADVAAEQFVAVLRVETLHLSSEVMRCVPRSKNVLRELRKCSGQFRVLGTQGIVAEHLCVLEESRIGCEETSERCGAKRVELMIFELRYYNEVVGLLIRFEGN